MNKAEVIKIINEEIQLQEQLATLSDILKMIDLSAFKNFVKEKNYNITNPDSIAQAIISWGKTVGKDFNKFKFFDLKKIAEYMESLVFTE